MTILIRNARVLTMDDDDTEHDSADILVRGSKIEAIGPNLPEPAGEADLRVIDARGMLAMPGLINSHFHSGANLLRGLDLDAPLSVYMLMGHAAPVEEAGEELPGSETHRLRSLWGATEMLKWGITAVHDDAHYAGFPTDDAVAGTMQGYADSGMRATVATAHPNVVEYEKNPFLAETLPEDVRRKMERAAAQVSADDLVALNRRVIERWHGACDGRIHAALSVSSPERVTPEFFRALSALSREHGLAFDVHVNETRYQRVLALRKHGKTFFRYMHDLGVLDERVMIIHAIWADGDDIEIMANAGCSVAHNPITNMWTGTGIMPFRRLREAGVPIALGIDEIDGDGTNNLWGVAKAAGLLHRMAEDDWLRWPKPHEMLWCLTRGGARAMCRQHEVGMLAPGYEADLILIDLNTMPFTPLNNLRRQLVFSHLGTSVVLTMVAGTILMENGTVLTVDEEALAAEVREAAAPLLEVLSQTQKAAEPLLPYWRDMHMRVAKEDVGIMRTAGPMFP